MPVAAASPTLLHPHGFLTEPCTNKRSQGKKHAGERSGYPCHVDIKPASGAHQAANAAGQYESPSACRRNNHIPSPHVTACKSEIQLSVTGLGKT